MNTEVIKEFLVSLGFGVDETSFAQFKKTIESGTKAVSAMAAAVEAAAGAIFFAISKIAESFEQMGYDLRILLPGLSKVLILRRALLQSYAAAGINIRQAVIQSYLFNLSLAKTKYALEAIYKSVGIRFLPLLTRQLDIFRHKIFAYMPKIQDGLETFVSYVFRAAQGIITFGETTFSFIKNIAEGFKDINKQSGGMLTAIGELTAAFWLLDAAMDANPIGLIVAGWTAFLLLYNDYQKSLKGAPHSIGWKKWAEAIKALKETFLNIKEIVIDALKAVSQFFHLLWDILHLDFKSAQHDIEEWGKSVEDVLVRLVGHAKSLWHLLKGVTKGADIAINGKSITDTPASSGPGFLEKATNWLSKENDKLNSNPQYFNRANFAVPNAFKGFVPNLNPNGGVDYNLKSQTTINVQGSADPNSTALAVAGQQTSVNGNLLRNMRMVVA